MTMRDDVIENVFVETIKKHRNLKEKEILVN
jgi:hypothetical protein